MKNRLFLCKRRLIKNRLISTQTGYPKGDGQLSFVIQEYAFIVSVKVPIPSGAFS